MRSLPALVFTFTLVAAVPTQVDAGRRPVVDPNACPEAAIQDIALPGSVRVDEIRVIVDDGATPEMGAIVVRVDDGRSDRVVRVLGPGSRGLRLSPALNSASFRVELDPVFEAPRSACVREVQLLHGGAPVAAIEL